MTRTKPRAAAGRRRAVLLAAAGLLALAAAAAGALAPGRVAADEDDEEPKPLEVRVSHWTPPDVQEVGPSPADRYLLQLELAPGDWGEAEVVADRRLLQLTVRPDMGERRRSPRLRCRHPDVPRRVSDSRVRQLGPGERWREWLDLRMYCFGRALRLLDEKGGEVEVTYGFRYRGRDRWVARRPDPEQEGEKQSVREVEAASVTFEPAPEPDRDPEAPVRIEMASRDVWSGGGVSFRVSIGATEGRERVYLKPDMWSFRVQGPLGDVQCGMPHQPIAPIVDFFSRITERREQREVLEADQLCPEDTFSVAGVYDVTAVVSLPYDGGRYGFDAVTGTYEGVPTPVRVRHDDRGYVEHRPEDWAGPAGEEVDAGDAP